ncbi:ORF6N domain-containing protein [Phocaeicola sp.]|jgi:ribosomal protein L23
MENDVQVVRESEVKELIIELRGEKVLIDRDVAKLYGVETKRVNEAVKNNRDKFPDGYMFSLQVSEKQQLVENFDRFAGLKHSPVEPKAFTEKGIYMLATILRSPRATATTFAIIESFFKLRELVRNVNIMSTERDEEKQKSLMQRSGELLNDLLADEGEITETESSIELNLYALKVKRTVKKTKKG